MSESGLETHVTNDPFDESADNPFEALFSQLAGGDGLPNFGAMLQELGAMLQSSQNSAVPWNMVEQSVETFLGSRQEDPITSEDRARYLDAGLLADAWLDQATTFPAQSELELWTRREWITRTTQSWKLVVEPLAGRVAKAYLPLQEQLPEEMAAFGAGGFGQIFERMGAIMFAGQVGQGLSLLSTSVLTTADVALPLTSHSECGLLLSNIKEFSEGLGLPDSDIGLYLSLRAKAHQRLVAHAPWLASRFIAAIDDYARGLAVDLSAMQEQIQGLNPNDIESLTQAIESGVFQPPETAEQKAALARIETLIALVDGWVDEVVTQAASAMPTAAALRETLQRRRASGGPAEQTFAALVGLELRPRRLREAAQLWERIRENQGMDARDGLWAHPDLLPTSQDLDDPDSFLTSEDLDLSELDDLQPFTDEQD
jgi:hypothetical protein